MILATTSAVALVATMSLALAQAPKGEQGQKEMSAPTMKDGGERETPKTGERKESPADKKATQEKTTKDSPKDAGKDAKKETSKDEKQATDKNKAKDTTKDAAKDEKSTGASKEAAGKDGKADAKGGSGSVTLSQEQRTKVQGSFAKHKGQSANVNITVNVGVAVPRTVELRAIPQDIIVIVPAYRRYRYFVVGDKVCIVDPDTYQIVEIIVIA
jgi:hypothetical protein